MSDNDQPLKSVSIPDYVVIERETQRIATRDFRREQNNPAQLEGLTQPEINQMIDDWNKRIELYDAMPQAQRDLLASIKSTGEFKVGIHEATILEHAQALEALELVRSTVNATARSRAYHLTELGRKFLYMNGL